MIMYKCFVVCKCIYFTFLMIIPSCKSILISYECIPKLNFILFAMGQFDWSFTKHHNTLILPKHYIPIWAYGGAIPRNILNSHFAPPHCLSTTFIPNFVHHHFWLKILQGLRYLLWFILINYVIYGASQSTNVIIIICNGSFGWPLTKNIMNPSPPPPKVEITFFTFFTFTLFYTI